MNNEKILCSGCTNKAKYMVNEHPVCGKHLTIYVDLHAPMCQGTVKVARIPKGDGK